MPFSTKQVLRLCTAAPLLVLTAMGLAELSQWYFTAYLRNEAARELALDATGGTPWIWDFRPENIIAGRVFGDAQATFTAHRLLVKSRGASFEIGLRLTRILPLRAFPRLRLSAFANKPGQAQIVVRERLDGSALTSAPFPLAGSSMPTNVDINKIEWRDPDGQSANPPASVAMLRLRFMLPQGSTLQFEGAAFDRPVQAGRLDLMRKVALTDANVPARPNTIMVYRVPERGLDVAQIAVITRSDVPILALPQTPCVECQRMRLDSIHGVLPAAIIVPQSALDVTFVQALIESTHTAAMISPTAPAWFALILYATALLLTRVFPPRHPRWRAALQAVLALAGPLWLIVGGHFTGEVDAAQKFLIVCIAIYAISLGYPRDWQWNGSRRVWILAAAVIGLAAVIGAVVHFADGGSIRAIGSMHVLRYFGWALIQQYLVCVVCTSRWRIATGSNAIAIYLGAIGFALLHTPNAGLMLATFVGGLCWCTLYLRERALLPLAFSHAGSALLLIALLPPSWLYSAEVSARFFQ